MKINLLIKLGVLLIILAAILVKGAACELLGGGGENQNNAPVVNSVTANPGEIFSGETSALTADATDQDGNPLTYNWSTNPGTTNAISGTGSAVVFTGPDLISSTQYRISVTVNDGNGGTHNNSAIVTVNPNPAATTSPTATASPTAPASPTPTVTVTPAPTATASPTPTATASPTPTTGSVDLDALNLFVSLFANINSAFNVIGADHNVGFGGFEDLVLNLELPLNEGVASAPPSPEYAAAGLQWYKFAGDVAGGDNFGEAYITLDPPGDPSNHPDPSSISRTDVIIIWTGSTSGGDFQIRLDCYIDSNAAGTLSGECIFIVVDFEDDPNGSAGEYTFSFAVGANGYSGDATLTTLYVDPQRDLTAFVGGVLELVNVTTNSLGVASDSSYLYVEIEGGDPPGYDGEWATPTAETTLPPDPGVLVQFDSFEITTGGDLKIAYRTYKDQTDQTDKSVNWELISIAP